MHVYSSKFIVYNVTTLYWVWTETRRMTARSGSCLFGLEDCVLCDIWAWINMTRLSQRRVFIIHGLSFVEFWLHGLDWLIVVSDATVVECLTNVFQSFVTLNERFLQEKSRPNSFWSICRRKLRQFRQRKVTAGDSIRRGRGVQLQGSCCKQTNFADRQISKQWMSAGDFNDHLLSVRALTTLWLTSQLSSLRKVFFTVLHWIESTNSATEVVSSFKENNCNCSDRFFVPEIPTENDVLFSRMLCLWRILTCCCLGEGSSVRQHSGKCRANERLPR